MAAQLTKATKLVTLPFTAVFGKVHTSAVKKLAFAEPEFTAQIAAHDAQGTDLAAFTTRNFIAQQFKLVPYRIVRMKDEFKELKTGNCCKDIGIKCVVVEARFLARLVALFMLCVMGARNSMFPLLEPTSPFIEGVKTYNNPNN
jgi:hypothetical protein